MRRSTAMLAPPKRLTLLAAVVALALPIAACDSSAGDPDGGATTLDAPVTPVDGPPAGGGCGRTGAATGVTNGSVVVGGVTRTFLRVVPASYDSSRAYPLIFAWHGRTGTAAIARLYFRLEAETGDDAIIVYPQGLSVSADPGDTGWELEAAGRDVALYDALAADTAAAYCLGSTYSIGHSFGGYLSNALACYRGGTGAGQVRAIAAIAGGGPFGSCPGDAISAIIIHGRGDQVVPFANGEASRDAWRTDAGCGTAATAITPTPCVEYGGCRAGLTVRWCAHDETTSSGHGWPAFAPGAAWQLFSQSP